jgi:hypothetical protein
MESGKRGKYLKYAIGEIVLVVIGILIALQINNWNNDRQDAKKEVAILLQLQNEYEENLKEVNEKIFMRDGMMASIKSLFDYIDNGIDGIPLDSIKIHIGRSSLLPTFDGPNGVTNEILNSGKLYLIKNSELKTHLTNWSGTTQEVIEEEQLLVTRFSKDYIEYVVHNFDYRKMKGNNEEDSFKEIWRLSKTKGQDYNAISGENDINEYKRYLSDTTISNYLVLIYNQCRGANFQAFGLREKIEQILEIIRSELKQKK